MTRLRSELGEAFVETALVGLVVMLLVLGILQFGLWYHGQHVVLGAAQEVAHAVALDGSIEAEGRARAAELVRGGLGGLAKGVSVSTSGGERVVAARVEATMASVVPFFPTLSLRAEGRAFKERFVPWGRRP